MMFIQARHHGGHTNTPVNRIVIHSTCPDVGFPSASKAGRAESTAHYFQETDRSASAHFVCDVSETVRCVPDDVVAWHAPPSEHSIGIEICSDGGARTSFDNPRHAYTADDWMSPLVWPAVARAAALTRQLCEKYNVPIRRLSVAQVRAGERGICGHNDVSEAFHKSDHDDPGPWFPWPEFIAAVKGGTTTQTGELSMSDVTSLTNLIKANQSQTHHDIGVVQTKLAAMDAVKNPRTGKVWRLKDALWSIWYYTLENRDRIVALEKKVK